MKYAVKVNNRKEQDLVCEKLGYRHITQNWNYITSDFDRFDKYQTVIYNGYEIITFEEFKSLYEPKLKIGDTFEYNGFVCEVKEEIKKWYKIEDNKNNKVAFEKLCKQDVLDILKLPYTKLTEITNKEFIKQLEENVR